LKEEMEGVREGKIGGGGTRLPVSVISSACEKGHGVRKGGSENAATPSGGNQIAAEWNVWRNEA